MSCLRQDFEDWTDSEPEELASDRPSEEEMAEFEEAEKKHAQKVRESFWRISSPAV